MSERAEGYYWTRYGTNPHWDVLYWRDGYFWDASDGGYRPEHFEIGARIAAPDEADQDSWPVGAHFRIDHDGFEGSVIGHYVRLDGKRGVVGQQAGTNIVHVYGEKWLKPAEADGNKPS